MIEEKSKQSKFRELAYLLDDDDHPLSLHIHNVPEAWSVHVYGALDETPVVRTGNDLSELIIDAVEVYRRRKAIPGAEPPRARKT